MDGIRQVYVEIDWKIDDLLHFVSDIWNGVVANLHVIIELHIVATESNVGRSSLGSHYKTRHSWRSVFAIEIIAQSVKLLF